MFLYRTLWWQVQGCHLGSRQGVTPSNESPFVGNYHASHSVHVGELMSARILIARTISTVHTMRMSAQVETFPLHPRTDTTLAASMAFDLETSTLTSDVSSRECPSKVWTCSTPNWSRTSCGAVFRSC